jgi:hypothetical protein
MLLLLLMVAATTTTTATLATLRKGSTKGEGHDAGNGGIPCVILYDIFDDAIYTEMERLRIEMNITSCQAAGFFS